MDSIPVKIDEKYKIEITDMTHTGEGIGRVNNFTIFVNNGVPGDILNALITNIKKKYAVGEIDEIIKESPYRINEKCKHSRDCGGCQIQNIDYKYQQKMKFNLVVDNLKRIGGFHVDKLNIKPIIGMEKPFNYRNKAQYKISSNGIGFYQKKSHNIINIEECHIQSTISKKTINVLNGFINKYKISIYNEEINKGLLKGIVERVSTYNDEIMLVLVINDEKFKYTKEFIHFVTKRIPQVKSIYLNINKEKTNVVLSKINKLVYGKSKIIDKIGSLKYEISPLSFFQVNSLQTEILYDKVMEYAELSTEEIVFDLYCGIGTISLYLAQRAKKVYGIEIVKAAIEDAKQNAKMNHITNVEFLQGKSEEIMPQLHKEEIKADVVVVDPPRKGCHKKLLESITAMKPKKIVYVSCNPSTLARDLAILVERGYTVKEVQPVDMFPHTMHVETVVLIEKK